MIQQAGGEYIIQVKNNQAELLVDLQLIPTFMPTMTTEESLEKGHGRIEHRRSAFYSLEGECFDQRWNESGIRTLAVMKRKTTIVKTGEITDETSYYISNKSLKTNSKATGKELFVAIREHWSVEADNYVRDVTFGEDKIKTPKGNTSRFLANIRTWAIQLVRKTGAKNLQAQVEEFHDCPNKLVNFLKTILLAPS